MSGAARRTARRCAGVIRRRVGPQRAGETFAQQRLVAHVRAETNGTPFCWGRDFYGQATSGGRAVRQISSGHSHTCGLTADGTPVCWGRNHAEQASPPAEARFTDDQQRLGPHLRPARRRQSGLLGLRGRGPVLGSLHRDRQRRHARLAGPTTARPCLLGAEGYSVAPPGEKFSALSLGLVHAAPCALAAAQSVGAMATSRRSRRPGHRPRLDQIIGGASSDEAMATFTCACSRRRTASLSAGALRRHGHRRRRPELASDTATPPVRSHLRTARGRHTQSAGVAAGWANLSRPNASVSMVISRLVTPARSATDGTAVCWGYQWDKPIPPRRSERSPHQHAAPTTPAPCAMTSGEPVCWGSEDPGRSRPSAPPPGETLADQQRRTPHGGLRERVACWGDSRDGLAWPPHGAIHGDQQRARSLQCALRDPASPCAGVLTESCQRRVRRTSPARRRKARRD